jgi:hypothetical protein
MGVPIVVERGEHELVLVRPTAVQHGLARAGTGGDGPHRQAGVPDLDQLVPPGSEDRGLELFAVPTAPRGPGHSGGHRTTVERFAFLHNPPYGRRQ